MDCNYDIFNNITFIALLFRNKKPRWFLFILLDSCLNQCTYCKTKHARGELGSYSPDEILARAKQAFQGMEYKMVIFILTTNCLLSSVIIYRGCCWNLVNQWRHRSLWTRYWIIVTWVTMATDWRHSRRWNDETWNDESTVYFRALGGNTKLWYKLCILSTYQCRCFFFSRKSQR